MKWSSFAQITNVRIWNDGHGIANKFRKTENQEEPTAFRWVGIGVLVFEDNFFLA